MDDTQIIEQLIEAQRGLMSAMVNIATAIEEINCQRPAVIARGAREQVANLAVAKAIEANTDFLKYARKASEELLERISPTEGFTF